VEFRAVESFYRPDNGSPGEPARARQPGFVGVDRSRILVGTTSWADKGLVSSGAFYPKRSMSARERLEFYASRFPLAEVATTYRFPPTADLASQWVDRTPPGFLFDIRAWSLLTGAPTLPDSLWPDLQGSVDVRRRDTRRLYATHLPPDVLEECWSRFEHALLPLRDQGRLGAVTFQYPGWFSPRPETWAELARLSTRLVGCQLAVELRNPKWLEGDACETTLEWLEQHGLAFVCVDGPQNGPRSLPLVSATTTDLAIVRFIGRREVADQPWTSPYRYTGSDLTSWLPRLSDLAASSPEVHVLMDNSWGSDAVENGLELAALLRADLDD
jgi:uncharacterized protein YecE (DUF72 family)